MLSSFRERKDIDSSIKVRLEAVSSTLLNNPERLIYISSLGESYTSTAHFNHYGDMKDIDLAIKKQLKAFAATTIDSPH